MKAQLRLLHAGLEIKDLTDSVSGQQHITQLSQETVEGRVCSTAISFSRPHFMLNYHQSTPSNWKGTVLLLSANDINKSDIHIMIEVILLFALPDKQGLLPRLDTDS